jgi:hypothetical protein
MGNTRNSLPDSYKNDKSKTSVNINVTTSTKWECATESLVTTNMCVSVVLDITLIIYVRIEIHMKMQEIILFVPPFVQEPQPVSIVQDYAVVSDQEHKVKVFDFKARGRDTQDNWAIGNSPIKTDMVLENLKNYPCKDTVSELTEGFLNGFKLHYASPRFHRESSNLVSASLHTDELKAKVQKEIDLGRIVDPFQTLPIDTLQISPKSDGKSWMMITPLSYSEGRRVNDFIDPDLCTVRYTSFDNVVGMISKLGKKAELGVIDIKSAFRLLRVHPDDFELLGIQIDGEYYIDRCLPMGCSISCKMFNQFSTFLHWLVEKKSGSRIWITIWMILLLLEKKIETIAKC